ncbi:MAG: hypothetical protein PUI35_08390 [Oscillibacter sp.]|nr:hypothetical protein [Oscillibacter sp.]
MKANYNLSEKYLRMIKDDEFFDVTKEDVKTLLIRMAHHYPRDDIIKMRIKYDAWIDDKEKRLMEEFGLSYDTHEITKTCLESGRGISSTRGSFCINGYNVTEWKMLTDEDYVPTITSVKKAINRIANRGDEEALEIIKMKYNWMFREQERGYLIKNGIDPDIPYTSVTRDKIDGMTLYRWRLLHDDNFQPKNKSVLVSVIHRLRKDGYDEDAELIEDKYLDFLHPDFMELHAEDYLAAEKFFSQFIHDDDPD